MAFFIEANIHVIYLTSKYLTCILFVFFVERTEKKNYLS